MLPGPFPPPGLPHPATGQGFNPQANPFQYGGQTQTRTHSQASHDVQSPVHANHAGHAAPITMPDSYTSAYLNTQAARNLKSFFEVQFGSTEFSDVTLHILERAQSPDPVVLPAHRIVLARSPNLRRLMETVKVPGPNIVKLEISAKYLDTKTFMQVLRYLYGAPLPTRNALAGNCMAQCLALAAMGCHVRLPEVTGRGLDYALSYMSWDNVEMALEFALQGGLTVYFRFNEYETVPEPYYGPIAGEFLRNMLNWMVENLPTNFDFIASAPQLSNSPRLPGILETRPSMANPHLSRIQFGDLPSEESSSPTMLLSGVLLSLPLGALRHVLQHPAFWSRPRHAEMTRAIIKEREIRRKKALESKRHVPGATAYMREAMYWEEKFVVVDGHAQGFTLERQSLKTTIGALGENGVEMAGEEA